MNITSSTPNIFDQRDRIINEYRSYIESFLKISDPRLKEFVQDQLDQGHL